MHVLIIVFSLKSNSPLFQCLEFQLESCIGLESIFAKNIQNNKANLQESMSEILKNFES